jgi:UDP-3-O-[3-hydroxymyristoyl] glucosamine N-acyltransferase
MSWIGLHRLHTIEYGPGNWGDRGYRLTRGSFFKPPPRLTIGEIAELTQATLRPEVPRDRLIADIAPLDRARPSDLTFLESGKHLTALAASRGGACLMTAQFEARAPNGMIALCVKEPYRAFVLVARKLHPDALRPSSLFDTQGAARGASVHPTAEIEADVTIDPGAVIGPRAAIGSGTVIGANAVIGPAVQIGRDCSIGPNVSIVHALIGDGVIVQAGCQIGHDGFRYHPGAQGHVKVPQIGRVIIQDGVEIGAGTTIDRGGGGDTVIGEGTKIDNLVQIGHNCTIGRHCIIVAQCGISGSVTLGDYVLLGGQVGLADHISIGEGAKVAGKSGVMHNIPPGEQWMGYPAMPARDFFRIIAEQRKRTK